jgi:nitric oxide reductase NorD protein
MQDPSGTDSQTSADAVPEDGSSDAESALAQQGATSSDAGVAADDGAGAGQPGDGQSSGTANVRTPPGVPFRYPEWDRNANDFHADGAIVRVRPAALASPEWADAALREHAVLVRQARQQFEQLQSQRVRLTRRNQGDDLDLDACVSAFVDRRAGHTPDDRLYTRVQPGRRALAITLLIDVSQSTREVVHESQRVIDLERLAALVAAAALDALGDDYSVLAFSSDGAADVRVTVVKEFADANSETVRRRISALAPDGKTRLGAAIRHATAGLSATDAPHRLLIILSDGKPNDRDRYFVDYGVADSRRAVVEARSEGVHPYCITVDREGAAEYMADIFGETGYLTVQKPEQLPRALLRAVQRLLD